MGRFTSEPIFITHEEHSLSDDEALAGEGDTASPVDQPTLDPENFSLPKQEFADKLGQLSRSQSSLSLPREVNRRAVVKAFDDAFHLIGGVSRLAVWAHSNETEFYKLYARLLPSQAAKQLVDNNETKVIHVLPKTDLDG